MAVKPSAHQGAITGPVSDRTVRNVRPMSALGQKRTFDRLFDQLIGELLELSRHH
jgi:hypothetical protein